MVLMQNDRLLINLINQPTIIRLHSNFHHRVTHVVFLARRVKGRELGEEGRAEEEDEGRSLTGARSDSDGGKAASLVRRSLDTTGRRFV